LPFGAQAAAGLAGDALEHGAIAGVGHRQLGLGDVQFADEAAAV